MERSLEYIRDIHPQLSITTRNTLINNPHLLELPQELRDQIFSYLLPHRIEIDITDKSSPGPSNSTVQEALMRPCASRTTCNVLRKVCKKTRADIELLLDEQVGKLTLVHDMSRHIPHHLNSPRMDQKILQRINRTEVRQCYGTKHSRQMVSWGDSIYQTHQTSLERLTLEFDRRPLNPNEFELTAVKWHEYTGEKHGRLNPRDQDLFKEQIESFVARRLQYMPRLHRSDPDLFTKVLDVRHVLGFSISLIFNKNPTMCISSKVRYAGKMSVLRKLDSILHSEVMEDWVPIGVTKSFLVDNLLVYNNWNRWVRSLNDAMGSTVVGSMP